MALKLIEQQQEFLELELEDIEDKISEKFKDLQKAKEHLEDLKKNMPRMTLSEVKGKWSLSFAAIHKWSQQKFAQFMKLDKESGNGLARMVGAFVGEVFGVPKIE